MKNVCRIVALVLPGMLLIMPALGQPLYTDKEVGERTKRFYFSPTTQKLGEPDRTGKIAGDRYRNGSWEFDFWANEKYPAGVAKNVLYLGPETSVVVPGKLGGYPVVDFSWDQQQRPVVDLRVSGEIAHVWKIDSPTIETLTFEEGVRTLGGSTPSIYLKLPKLKSFVMPNSLTNLPASIFAGCGALTNVVLNSTISEIPSSAFSKTSITSVGGDGTSVRIPPNVTTIGTAAFAGCTNLQSVTIPGTVKTIGDNVFADCPNLKSVTIEEGVEQLGSGMFRQCTNLESVVLPETLKGRPTKSFYGNGSSRLTSVVLPKRFLNQVALEYDFAFTKEQVGQILAQTEADAPR